MKKTCYYVRVYNESTGEICEKTIIARNVFKSPFFKTIGRYNPECKLSVVITPANYEDYEDREVYGK